MSAAEILTTQWSDVNRPQGQRVRLDLYAWLAEPREGEQNKLALPGWAPATFKGDHRKKANVEAVYALGIEYDKAHPSAADLAMIWSECSGAAHTTWSATAEAPRWRVVLELSRPLTTLAEHAKVWAWADRRSRAGGYEIAQGEKDASRLWFVPAVPPSGYFETVRFEGAPLDVDAILASEPEPELRGRPRNTNAGAAGLDARTSPWVRVLDGMGRRLGEGNADAVPVLCLLAHEHSPEGNPDTSGTYILKPLRAGERGKYYCNHGHGERISENPHEVIALLTPEQREQLERACREADPRARILVTLEEGETVDAAIAALASDPDIYQRNGELVELVKEPQKAPKLRALPFPDLRQRIGGVAIFERYNAKAKDGEPNRVRVPVPKAVTEGVATRGRWGLREVAGILEAPTMRPDGSIIQEPGYDDATGYLYAPSIAFEAVPEAPTQADACAALRELCEVWREFPFADEPSRYVPIAALLTLLARPAIDGPVPAFLYSAAKKGTGKSLLADTVAMIATGREDPRAVWHRGRNSIEETCKSLDGIAMHGTASTFFDNLEDGATLESAELENALTSRARSYRPLGKTDRATSPWVAVLSFSGNNITIAGALQRRFVVCRMVAKGERPEERTGFAHEKLLVYVREHRARLARAALTMLRAFVVAGRPEQAEASMGSFEEWAGLVAGAILYAGGADVVEAVASRDEQGGTPEEGAIRRFVEALHKLDPMGKGLQARAVLEAAYGFELGPVNKAELKESIETLTNQRAGETPSPLRLGQRLGAYVDNPFDDLGLRLVRRLDRNKTAFWAAVPV